MAVLVRGCHWTEALTLVRNMAREDLVQTHLGPGLLERREKLINSIQARRIGRKGKLLTELFAYNQFSPACQAGKDG